MHAASDAELVARCRAGDARGLGAARRPLLALRLRDRDAALPARAEHDAEDVFQEVFARVFERLGTLRDDDALRPVDRPD